jgi:hypothetical protein
VYVFQIPYVRYLHKYIYTHIYRPRLIFVHTNVQILMLPMNKFMRMHWRAHVYRPIQTYVLRLIQPYIHTSTYIYLLAYKHIYTIESR